MGPDPFLDAIQEAAESALQILNDSRPPRLRADQYPQTVLVLGGGILWAAGHSVDEIADRLELSRDWVEPRAQRLVDQGYWRTVPDGARSYLAVGDVPDDAGEDAWKEAVGELMAALLVVEGYLERIVLPVPTVETPGVPSAGSGPTPSQRLVREIIEQALNPTSNSPES